MAKNIFYQEITPARVQNTAVSAFKTNPTLVTMKKQLNAVMAALKYAGHSPTQGHIN